MTREEAMDRFNELFTRVLQESTVLRELRTAHRVDRISVSADLILVPRQTTQQEPADKREVIARHDTEFLRKLCITPDVEVRE